ncbi:hypothetical protein NCH01_03010 [Neoasaia chiangmaiensis]|nr:hypothetical protein [Neoasaia chiangmaiensis]GEN13870.1 hypothetical protein NCH01_03010 [Neoasaia chiangmaiensis]
MAKRKIGAALFCFLIGLPQYARAASLYHEWVVYPRPLLKVIPVASASFSAPKLPTGWAYVGNTGLFFQKHSEGNRLLPNDVITSFGAQSDKVQPPSIYVDKHEIWLPLKADALVAAYRSGENVFISVKGRYAWQPDNAQPTDMPKIKEIRNFNDITLIRVFWPGDQGIIACPARHEDSEGWHLTDDVSAKMAPILMRQMGHAIIFSPNDVNGGDKSYVTEIRDPISGRRILLGMTKPTAGEVQQKIRGPGYEIRSSLVGVVVAADADTLELRSVTSGFVLDAIGTDAVPVQMPSTHIITDSPGLMLADASKEVLRENFRRAWTSAATVKPARRFSARMTAVRSALALGNSKDASNILDVALRDNPEGIDQVGVPDLQRAVNILQYRTKTLDAAADGNSAEDQLWRGLALILPPPGKRLTPDQTAQAASLLSNGFSIMLTYPQPLRDQLTPIVVEWMARHGSADIVAKVLEKGNIPGGQLARALVLARNDSPAAANTLKEIARTPDPVESVKAQEAFLLLAGRTQQLSPMQVAEGLDNLRPSARLANRESSVLIEEIQADVDGGQWEAAQALLPLLKRIENNGPDDRSNEISDFIEHMHEAHAHVMDLTTDQAAQLLSATQAQIDSMSVDDQKTIMLNNDLTASFGRLGLPGHALEAMRKLEPRDNTSEAHQNWVINMAGLLIADKQEQKAVELLTNNKMQNGNNIERSQFLIAKAQAMLGNSKDASMSLDGLTSDESFVLRAELAEKASQWRDATSALQQISFFRSPPLGKLDADQQNLIMRLSADAARAGNRDLLSDIWEKDGDRVTDPELHKLLSVMTNHNANQPATLSQR